MLAIAHNGNLSNGIMFPLEAQYDGRVLDEAYVRNRATWEPLYEVTQIKGDGEAHPLLSPDDEFADYETWDVANLDMSTAKTDAMLPGEYAREALKRRFLLEDTLGVNPYKFGMIGSTDSHTSLATAQEDNFFGKHTGYEPSPTRIEPDHPAFAGPGGTLFGWQMVSSSLAAVWANENTRESIFDAMERKEVYATIHGEGHRKVHARLRILDGIRVARTRVLRVMRAHGLLSPHRGRQGAAKTHDGRVITQTPNVMWGTDGVRVFTLDDGWGWIFAAVEHWNAECVGWHVCKVGSRFAALDPIAQGLERLYGSLDADVARGLALRMDHGSQYLSDHFLKQIRYWGIHPSFGFVEEPETNGVVERWNRTLKEQAIHGRIFQNLEAVRVVADFVVRYNQTWRLEKLGYQTPIEAREEYELRQAA